MGDVTLTSVTALYGAIMSSILLGWSIYRDLSDRGRLKVRCFIGNEEIVGVGTKEESELVYVVTNTGKKPVYVTHIGGRHNKKYAFIIASFGKQKLEAGDEIVFKCGIKVLNDPISNLWAIDSLNNTYKISRKNLRCLISEYNKIKSESIDGKN